MSNERVQCLIDHGSLANDAPQIEAMYAILDELSDRIADFHRSAGRDVDAGWGIWPDEYGSLMVVNSDTPSDMHLFWVVPPAHGPARGTMVDLIVSYVRLAREACPQAQFSLQLRISREDEIFDLL